MGVGGVRMLATLFGSFGCSAAASFFELPPLSFYRVLRANIRRGAREARKSCWYDLAWVGKDQQERAVLASLLLLET